jgi:NAD(P)-dependent dehydrogenase (short-subunit alcohol dehydrogenase family)
MITDFSGKVALVTGGGNGIGRASSLGFAREGASVLVSDINEAAGRAVVGDIKAAGGEADFIACDVTKEDQVRTLMDATLERYGRLDFAHNNAGNMWGAPDFGGYSVDDWDRTLDLSLKSNWLCMRAELPVMAANGGGAIVNTTSMAGVRTSAGANAAYSAAKAGVISLTDYAAVHYAKDNIRVNVVAPGLVRTKVVQELYTKEVQNQMAASLQPIGRILEPEEIADAVIFLCSDRAAMITGVTVPVCGGYNAA